MVENIVLSNLDTKHNLMMNMDDADYLLYEGSIDWGTIDTKHNTFKYPNQVGKYITNTSLGTRDVAISGWIVGKTEQEIITKKEILSKVINPMHTIRVKAGEYGIEGCPSSNVKFSNAYKENNDKMCKFLIRLFCSFPLFDLDSDVVVSMADITPLFHFPLIIPKQGISMSVRKRTTFTDVVNGGTIPVGCTIRLVATGTVHNPRIINVHTQQYIQINKTMEAGEEIVINTKDNRYIYGIKEGVKESYLDYFDFDSTWLMLQVGLNTLTYKTYASENVEDETYKNLNINLSYNPCIFNLKEE